MAVLEQRLNSLEEVVKEQIKTTQRISKDLTEIVTTFRLFKWIIGIAIAVGPALGVLVGKLYEA